MIIHAGAAFYMNRFLIGAAGIAVILLIAVVLSSNRRAIRLRVVLAAFALQAGIAVLVLTVPAGVAALQFLSGGVANLLGYANAGTSFSPVNWSMMRRRASSERSLQLSCARMASTAAA